MGGERRLHTFQLPAGRFALVSTLERRYSMADIGAPDLKRPGIWDALIRHVVMGYDHIGELSYRHGVLTSSQPPLDQGRRDTEMLCYLGKRTVGFSHCLVSAPTCHQCLVHVTFPSIHLST